MDLWWIMKLSKAMVTGGCGFIGSNLTNWLVTQDCKVVVIDNLVTGKVDNIDVSNPLVTFKHHDLLDPIPISFFDDVDVIFHFAANADIRHGMDDSQKDIEQNIVATEKLMKSAVQSGVKDIIFSSTAAALGEPEVFPTPEGVSIPVQTSLYGMSKMAAEGVLSAYAGYYGLRVSVFRFVSIVGPRYSHGHIIDFVHKLRRDSSILEILGDGQQQKSYLHVSDMLTAIDAVLKRHSNDASSFFEVYHLGNSEYCKVVESANTICDSLSLAPEYHFTGGEARMGWR